MPEGDYVLRNSHRVEATRDVVRRLAQTPAAIAAYARRDAIRTELAACAAMVLAAAGQRYLPFERELVADGIARRTNAIDAGDLEPTLTGALKLQDNIWPAVAAKMRQPDWATSCLQFSREGQLAAPVEFLDFSPSRPTVYKPCAYHPIASLASARALECPDRSNQVSAAQDQIETLLSRLADATSEIIRAYAELPAIVDLIDAAHSYSDLLAIYPRAAEIDALRPRAPLAEPAIAESALHALQNL
jgi:hypothetical protein